jgi:hypothetical protein
MKRLHLERGSDLLRALIVIQEDSSSEKQKQEKMARRLKGSRMDEKDEEEDAAGGEEDTGAEGGGEEAGDEGGGEGGEEGGEEAAADKPKKSGKLPGAKRLEDAELKQGQDPTTKDIIQRINFVRAGASLKDEKVKKDISTWIAQLKEPERLAVYTTLDALAKIVLGRKSAAEAPTFMSPNNLEIKDTEPDSPSPTPAPRSTAPVTRKQSAGPVPITVGEGVVKKLKEIDVPVRSGRVVPFGSKSHISDIEDRIEDLKRIRAYQERGSDTHHALGLAISALKKQLIAAYKRNGGGNPRTQPVPPIVEKGK